MKTGATRLDTSRDCDPRAAPEPGPGEPVGKMARRPAPGLPMQAIRWIAARRNRRRKTFGSSESEIARVEVDESRRPAVFDGGLKLHLP